MQYEAIITGIVVPIMLAVGGGLVWWAYSLSQKISSIELDLAKNYHDSDDLEKVLANALAPILTSVQRLERVIDRAFPQGQRDSTSGS